MPSPRHGRARRRTAPAIAAAALAIAFGAHGQVEMAAPKGDRLSGFVIPTEPGAWPVTFRSGSAWTWKVDSTQRLYLSGKVQVQMGTYDFSAERAVVWIERIPSAKGLITQLAMWFPDTIEPTKAAGLGAGGSNLFVTASTSGDVSLSAVLFEAMAPPPNEDLARAEHRLAAYLGTLRAEPPPLRILPEVIRPPKPPPPAPLVVGGIAPADPSVAAAIEAAAQPSAVRPAVQLPDAPAAPETPGEAIDPKAARPIIAPDSVVAFAAEQVDVDSAADEVTLTKGASVDVLPRFEGGTARALQLRADRGVVFLRKGTLAALREGTAETRADTVLGIYLEGEVFVTDFKYVIRARRAYYDFALNRASMVDGVMRTQDRRGMPLVARAKELRQYSQRQFEGEQVKVSMSEFFEPQLSIGADRATITQTEEPGGGTVSTVTAHDVTFNAGSVPFFWLPEFESSGDMTPPLRGMKASYSGNTGAQINTKWNPWALLGIAKPPEADIDLVEEALTNYGVGGGVNGTLYGTKLNALGIYDFRNQEQTSAGQEVTATNAFRGTVEVSREFKPSDSSRLQLRASYVSDESFLQVWRQQAFASEAQRETSAYWADTGDRSEISLLGSVPTNDVITNSSQLAARPYQVRKYPEFAYKRWGDTLFGDSITWQQEYSANLMSLDFGRGSQASTGVIANTFNLNGQLYAPGKVFGQNTSLTDLYQAQGYSSDSLSRLYTRQELAAPLGDGNVRFTPFASANVVGYVAGDPQAYNAAGDRLHGIVAGGFRSSTDITSVFDGFEVASLDLHRMRHVVTPYVNTWAGWNTTQNLAYAVYDQEIEGATGGAAVQAGVKQKLQTMRGGPGNWQSVDWLALDVGLTWNESGDDLARTYQSGAQYRQSPFPQYFAWRPELSQWGRNAYASFTMAASSSLTFRGNITYLLQENLPNYGAGAFGLQGAARGSIGATMQHSTDVSTFLEYRGINNNSPDSIYVSDQLLSGGVNYQISKAYTFSFVPTYDLQENDFRMFTVNLQREMQDFTLFATFGYDAIQNQYFGGLNIRIGGQGGSPVPFSSLPINR